MLINIELILFQELESAVHWRLYHADWFVNVDLLIFHMLMILIRPWVEAAVCQRPDDMALRMRWVLARPWVLSRGLVYVYQLLLSLL